MKQSITVKMLCSEKKVFLQKNCCSLISLKIRLINSHNFCRPIISTNTKCQIDTKSTVICAKISNFNWLAVFIFLNKPKHCCCSKQNPLKTLLQLFVDYKCNKNYKNKNWTNIKKHYKTKKVQSTIWLNWHLKYYKHLILESLYK